MTQKVKISYSSPGLQPPVFIAGSLGDEPWRPIEMDCKRDDYSGELNFWKEFDLEEGEYQYKFRLGPGDWWVLDETHDIVDDGAGNRNNLLVVKAQQTSAPKQTHEHENAVQTHVHDDATAAVQEPESATSDLNGHHPGQDGLSAHEPQNSVLPTPHHTDFSLEDEDEDDIEPFSPLFRHESLSRIHANAGNDEADQDNEDDEEPLSSPLFRHESLSRIHTNPANDDDVPPLFRHESMSPTGARPRLSSGSARSGSFNSHRSDPFEDEDLSDPTLEKFPTARDDIIKHLHRVSSRTSDDGSALDAIIPSPTLSSAISFSAATSPSLSKGSSDHLDAIDEDLAEEVIPELEETTVMPGSAQEVTSGAAEYMTDQKEPVTKLTLSAHEPVHRGPPTPPMTPTREVQSKVNNHDESDAPQKAPRPTTPKFSQAHEDSATNNVAPPSESESVSDPAPESKDSDAKQVGLWNWLSKLCSDRAGSLGIAVAVAVVGAFYAIAGRDSATKVRSFIP
ncbi:hypothetical protein AAFC00_004019 [Neodothiora populina]|uniref:AMP-activated protein kinase glycogen-binding domain-containing protein n=1 Tax=Neodothiora populina TaxID=2781224 RepID=A0ABR3PIM3_9PEZI